MPTVLLTSQHPQYLSSDLRPVLNANKKNNGRRKRELHPNRRNGRTGDQEEL